MSPKPHEHGGPECRELFSRLSEYLDGEIDAAGCEAVDEHLADCPPCRDFLESLRRTVRLVQAQPQASLSPRDREALIESFRKARKGLSK